MGLKGTWIMNEYSYPEGKYSSAKRQRELLGEQENVSVYDYEVLKKESNQKGESVCLPKDVSKGVNHSMDCKFLRQYPRLFQSALSLSL